MCKKLIYLTSFVLVLGLVLTSVAEAVDPDLAGWWKLDETYGTIAYDSSGNGNDGTLQGDPQWVAGKMGGAIELDGSGDYVEVPHSDSLNISDAVTVALWAYDTGPSEVITLITKGSGAEAWYSSYGMTLTGVWPHHDISTARWVAFSGLNAKFGGFYSNSLMPLDEWTHIVVTFDKSAAGNNQKMYFNGVLDAEHRSEEPLETNTDNVLIGADAYPAGSSRWHWHGMLDDVRIYSRALTEAEIQQVMKGIPPGLVSNPSPADEATDVPREVVLSWEPGEFAAPTNGHKVYFGESFDDVNDATGGVAQSANSYTLPERLDFGTTYYWRVDEVNAPPSSTIFKGDVWSFTAEPIGYAIENITATASSSGIDQGQENTVNGSGLDVNDLDLHSTELTDMWISNIAGPQPTWIEYELDKVCKLHQMWVWNHNTLTEAVIGFGVKEATIEYSLDGNDYTTLGTTHEFARGSGAAGYAYNTTVDFGGVAVKYVRLTISSNWGGLLPQYGLSEVRFLYIPVWAREPNPASGATDVDLDVVLGFRAGREAAEHNVYLSTDEQAVIDGNAGVTTVTENSYSPSPLDIASTYYWRVDEVNEAETPTMLQGDIWNFTTLEYLVVDDFGLYNDLNPDDPDSNRIFNTWIDGYDNPAINGSVVGYAEVPFTEQSIVYDGKQSMPLNYDNSTAGYSEATANVAALQVGQDWAKHGIKALTLRFFGDPNNAVQQMYVKLNGSKVTYDGDAENIRRTGWQMWYIDLASLGVSLSNVTELSIGFERSGAVGGQGVVYFDGIRLYSHDRQLITPVEPGTANLVGHWQFDEGSGTTAADSSGNNNHGTITGTEWVAGQVGGALNFKYGDEYVEVPAAAWSSVEKQATVAFWAYGYPDAQPQSGFIFGAFQDPAVNNSRVMCAHVPWGDGNVYFDTGGTADGFDRIFKAATPVEYEGSWQHWTFTKDADTGEQSIYLNGFLWRSGTGMTRTMTGVTAFTIGCKPDLTGYYAGMIDDFRLYDRALSQGEVAWLADVTKPFDKPF